MIKLIFGVGILFANFAHAKLVIQCPWPQGVLLASEQAGEWSLNDSCDANFSRHKAETVFKTQDSLIIEVSAVIKHQYAFFGLKDCGRYEPDMEVISLTVFRLNLRGEAERSLSTRCTCVKN